MKPKKISKKNIANVLQSLFGQMEKEDMESPFFKFLGNNIQYIKNPEEFYTMAVSPLHRVVETFIRSQIKNNNPLTSALYSHYDFFEHNLSELCSQWYGSACSVDRSRYLIEAALQWGETRKLPVFNWKQEYTYHYPPTGTPEQWMQYIDGLHGLFYGKAKPYLTSLKTLMKQYFKAKKVKQKTQNAQHKENTTGGHNHEQC
jgi:hypothetical protein